MSIRTRFFLGLFIFVVSLILMFVVDWRMALIALFVVFGIIGCILMYSSYKESNQNSLPETEHVGLFGRIKNIFFPKSEPKSE